MGRRLRENETIDSNGYIRRGYSSKDDENAGFFLALLITAIATLVWFFNWVAMHWKIVTLIFVASVALIVLIKVKMGGQ